MELLDKYKWNQMYFSILKLGIKLCFLRFSSLVEAGCGNDFLCLVRLASPSRRYAAPPVRSKFLLARFCSGLAASCYESLESFGLEIAPLANEVLGGALPVRVVELKSFVEESFRNDTTALENKLCVGS